MTYMYTQMEPAVALQTTHDAFTVNTTADVIKLRH